MLLEKSGEIASEGMKRLSQSDNSAQSGDESKVRCCNKQYWKGTWNARSISQGKLKVIKQEMAREHRHFRNQSIPKWMGMGEFN